MTFNSASLASEPPPGFALPGSDPGFADADAAPDGVGPLLGRVGPDPPGDTRTGFPSTISTRS